MTINTAYAQQATRFVSVDSNATELLISLGFESNIVATDVTSQKLLTTKVPDLGYHRLLNPEGVLSVRPDLIIGSDHMGPATTVNTIKKTNIELIQLTSPRSVSELTDNIQQLGQRLGAEEKSAVLINRINQQTIEINKHSEDKEPVMVFILDMGGKGLSQGGKNTAGDALISLLHGINASEFSNYKPISIESLLTIQPDVILIGQRTETPVNLAQLYKKHPLLAKTKAANNNKIISVNAANLIAGLSLSAIDEAEKIVSQLSVLNTK